MHLVKLRTWGVVPCSSSPESYGNSLNVSTWRTMCSGLNFEITLVAELRRGQSRGQVTGGRRIQMCLQLPGARGRCRVAGGVEGAEPYAAGRQTGLPTRCLNGNEEEAGC